MQIEINLAALHKAQAEPKSSGRPGLVKKKVTVKRGGKTFQQYRWVRTGAEEPTEKKPAIEEPIPQKKEPVIMGLNKPEKKPDKPDFASGLKKGMTINFMGEDKKIQFYNTDVKTVTFFDDDTNYPFADINKYGTDVGGKPKVEKPEVKKTKPKPNKEVYSEEDAKKNLQKYIGTKAFKSDKKTQKAIDAYTLTDFWAINSYLREGDLLGSDKGMIEGYIDKFSSFLDNAPKVSGTFYRGMRFYKDDEDALNDMKDFIDNIDSQGEGGEIELSAFTSTTSQRDMAENFADYEKKWAHSVVMEVKTKNGVYLNGLSPITSEVTLNKNSKFKVISFDKSDPDKMILKLEEI